MDLSEEKIERYSRNIVLAEIGPQGQERIRRGKVLIVGAGGLGSPAALYLAAAGIGVLGLIDSDKVELSNLQRQILHDTRSLGEAKTRSAGRRIRALNPDVAVRTFQERFSVDNALSLVREFDFVIDGSDNFATKFLVNDACVLAGKPFSHAGVLGFRGQVLTVDPSRADSPCLRCLLPEPPGRAETPDCSRSGVLGALTGILGSIQALETLKFLTGAGELLCGRLLTVDALKLTFRTVAVRRNPECPLCSGKKRITALDQALYV